MSRMFFPRAIIVCAITLTFAVCQHAKASEPSDYLMSFWTSDDGLPDTSVTAITQTPDGYLWIGTFNGLARFDGVRFTIFDPANTPELKSARVLGLFTDAHGTLWIDTYDGSMVSFRDGVFKREWQGTQVVKVFCAANRIYFATMSGLATRIEYGAGTNQWQLIPSNILGAPGRLFCQDATGAIWCSLRDGQIRRIVGTNVMQLPGDAGLKNQKVNYLTADPSGHVWAGTDKKILRWNGEHFEDETPTNGPPPAVSFLFCTAGNGIWAFTSNSVRHAVSREWKSGTTAWSDLIQADPLYINGYEDKSGNVWFRQFGHGLFCVHADENFSRLCSTNGLPDNRVSCWYQDRENNIWVGMERGGLARLRKREFQTIGGNLENAPVATVCEDDQSNVWLGTFDNGLNLWRNGRLQHFKLSEGANRNAFFSAFPDVQNQLWLSANHEDLFVLETNKTFHRVDSIHGVKAIFADSRGRLWLGQHNQLTCLDHGKPVNYNQRNGFARSTVRALAEDRQGNIWIGSDDGVLYKFADGQFSAFKPDNGTNSHAIWSLFAADDGTIWVGTFRGGLLRFRNGKFTRYTTDDGLPSDIICQIADDRRGKLWFGSHKGIFYIPENSFAEYDRRKIKSLPCIVFGLEDGLPTLECSGGYQPSVWRERNGRLWFATMKGAVAVDPEQVQPNLLPPPVVIEDAMLDDKKFQKEDGAWKLENGRQTQSSALPPMSRLKIPPGKHSLDFQFAALSFTTPDKVRFRYRLEGFENNWVEGGTKRVAHYGPLPPGNYKFQVIACNNDGVWNETGASLALTQLPFFWQTWWFTSLIVIAGGLCVAGIVAYAATRRLQRNLERLKQQRAIQLERERIAKDIHDDLGAGLTQIIFQSSLATHEPPERMKTDLSQISDSARDLVRTMDEIVWAINPENDTLDGLVTYLGKFVSDFLAAAKLRCRLDLPSALPDIVVPSEIRHNVYLAIREILNNAVKHARATEVSFQFQLRNGTFALIIKDDGVGFGEEKPGSGDPSLSRISSGHGLRHLPQRLEDIGGSCNIVSQSGQGTQVELIIPFNRNHNKTTNYE